MGTDVDVIERKMIKPSSPTPSHLKNLKLSLLDQIIPPMYGLIVFFYPAEASSNNSDRSARLKDSLSQTLTTFYPMAGRTKADEPSIDCSDDGALFVEAKIEINLSDFLGQPDTDRLNHFVPTNDPTTAELAQGCITQIQLTAFQCGGTAVSACLSHKVGDISSLISFLNSWSSTTRDDPYSVIGHPPVFIGDSLLPPIDMSLMQRKDTRSEKLVSKRFVFEASKIAQLKAKVSADMEELSQKDHYYTSRVEVVLALILKCAVAASRTVRGSFKQSVLFQAVNLRPRMDPPLPENSIGNLLWFLPVVIEESDMELGIVVHKMKKLVNEFVNDKAMKFKDDVLSVLGEFSKWRDFQEMELYSCSSWCKFPLYETDFGWGKPMWVSSASLAFKNSIILVDTKEGDGVEAWVTLDEENMVIFEKNGDLLNAATFNPSALDITTQSL
ncbi:stemmadenine O-acetyltransferase-like [Humulus lupulus]|uniref:stemmadenine O-acetyltransferase-like n=1 Tax=Humulus lupulus TaxID=3486 RepID=UPI002B415D10|nr:stemmadenine O-acetyltransferase-like [Humulus lupulus]